MKETAWEAFIYGFPMIMNYKTMWSMIENDLGRNRNPFNKFGHFRNVTSAEITWAVAPNADTPYSFAWLDLRVQPVVICVPRIRPADRYFSIQLIDLYTFNIGYIGSRTTGNSGGCFLIHHLFNRAWIPGMDFYHIPGIKKTFVTETQFLFALGRTQLFNFEDLQSVNKIQDQYRVYLLSEFLRISPPCRNPPIRFPKFVERSALSTKFANYMNFLLRFAQPINSQDKAVREKFGKIGIRSRGPFAYEFLNYKVKRAVKVKKNEMADFL